MSLFGGRNQDPDTRVESASGAVGERPAQVKNSGGQTGRGRSSDSGRSEPATRGVKPRSKGGTVAAIGCTIVFSGELTGDEDLEILGKVKGKIELPSHQLTVGEGGTVTAEIEAKSVLVIGQICGNVSATERVEVQANGIVEGDIRAPRLLIQEGAVVNGAIEMTKSDATARAKTPVRAPDIAAPSVPPPTA